MLKLKALFEPKSVAVVGASTREGSVGSDTLKNLIKSGYKGKIYPVNPKAKILSGLKCYQSISQIKTKIDLVLIIVPAAIVAQVLEEAGRLGVPAAIIISAGFKDVGRQDLEIEIKKIAQKYNIAVLGPNCLGLINPSKKLNLSFAPLMPKAGGLAFLTQSGALGTAIIDIARDLNIGFSVFASVGNKAVIDEADLISYWKNDKKTKVFGIYAEQLNRPEILGAVIDNLCVGANPKPVVILKSGRTSIGASASLSHTGAMAGNDAVYDAFFSRHGVIRANSVNEFFSYLQIFNNNKHLPAKRVAIITNAGGPGILAVDALAYNGLNVASLSLESKQKLKKVLPAAGSSHNPVDLLGDAGPERYRAALEIISQDAKVDSMLIVVSPQSMTRVDELTHWLVNWQKKCLKPLAVCLMGASLMEDSIVKLRQVGVAVYTYPEEAVKALAALSKFNDSKHLFNDKKVFDLPKINRLSRHEADKIFIQAKAESFTALAEFQVLPILKAYGIPTPKFILVDNNEDAILATKYFKGRLAIKVASPDILHKSDVGGVMLNVEPGDIPSARKSLLRAVSKNNPKARLFGVLIMPMFNPGLAELIVGAVKDNGLGHALMLGWGGIYTEIIKDSTFILPPFNKTVIREMFTSLKVNTLLDGARGAKAADKKAVVDILLRLYRLLQDFPQIKEIDLNPVVVYNKGVMVLDAKITLDNN
ncbi:MAG: acetate--CoA ligase family protein [Patescibacteria group bacterium]|nr:acetate--CoA ligase family protein [Patescibacteria group bacterium]